MRRLLVLMAKQPMAGNTKTRLTPMLSPQIAADLYQCFLLDKIEQMRQVTNADPGIAFVPEQARPYFEGIATGFRLMLQQGADLSARLKHVFEDAFQQGYQQVVAIDGDTVTLPPGYLQQAFTVLEEVDVSLGSCEDGGYYAIGLTQPYPTLFDVTMSTPDVTRDTLAQAANLNLDVRLLPVWYDVDTPADLERLMTELAGQTTSHTARFLQMLVKEKSS